MLRMRELAVLAALAIQGLAASTAIGDETARPTAVAARLAQDASGARLVFDVSQPVPAHAYALSSPDRIVVDMPEVAFGLDPSVGRVGGARELVSAFRFGLLSAGKSRIVIDLVRPACPGEVSSKPIVEGSPPQGSSSSSIHARLPPSPRSSDHPQPSPPTPISSRTRRRRSFSIPGTAAQTAERSASGGSWRRRSFSTFASSSSGASKRRADTRSS
ncbi:MAG: AMIN domain-containing protein [Hyphomicrobiales bacterium]|nr:AMIN domain-containing protein [Hyphomicrobiales bacterium]